MKKILFVLLVVLTTQNSFAQSAQFQGEISWSELFPVSRKISAPNFIGQDGDFAYLLRYVKKKRVVEKYTLSTLKLAKTALVELKVNGHELTLEDQFMFGNNPILYSSYYDKKERINYSFAHIMNPNTLALSKPFPISNVKVEKQKGLLSGVATRYAGGNAASSFYLSDDLKLGLVVDATDDDKVELYNQAYKFKLFDNEFALITENTIKLPYTNFQVNIIKVGDDGLVYFVGSRMTAGKDDGRLIKRDIQIPGDLEVLVINIESGEIESLNVILKGDRKVASVAMRVTDKGDIILAGLSNKGAGVTGSFYSKFNYNLQEEAAENYDFEENFITTTWTDKAKKQLNKKQSKASKKGGAKVEPDFYNYKLRDLIMKDDNSSTLLAEQYYVRVVTTTHTNSSGGTYTTTTYYYYYNDVIAINFNENGQLDWKTIVKKNQTSINDQGYYLSFFSVTNNNEINIIYNDFEYNATDAVVKKGKMKRNIVGVKVKLDEDGNQSKEILFEFEENGLKLVPKICGQAKNNLVFMYARGGKGDKLGLIEL